MRIAGRWIGLAGQNNLKVHSMALETIRSWPIYGSTFFAACKSVPPSGYFELRIEHYWVGVNTEGLCVIDGDKNRVIWNGPYETSNWKCTSDTFTIEGLVRLADSNLTSGMPLAIHGRQTAPPVKRAVFALITPQAHLIDSLASRAVYNLEKLKQLDRLGGQMVIQNPASNNNPVYSPIAVNGGASAFYGRNVAGFSTFMDNDSNQLQYSIPQSNMRLQPMQHFTPNSQQFSMSPMSPNIVAFNQLQSSQNPQQQLANSNSANLQPSSPAPVVLMLANQ